MNTPRVSDAPSLRPPWHEWVNDVINLFGAYTCSREQRSDGALGKAGMQFNAGEPLLSDDPPRAVDVQSGGRVLVQRRNAKNRSYAGCSCINFRSAFPPNRS
jgi:hypothetical protein